MTWSDGQLRHIEGSDDFKIAPYREEGATPGTLIWVWSAVVDQAVFVRSTNPVSRWFAAAMSQRAGIVETSRVPHQVRLGLMLTGPKAKASAGWSRRSTRRYLNPESRTLNGRGLQSPRNAIPPGAGTRIEAAKNQGWFTNRRRHPLPHEALRIAGALEVGSTHPVVAAILDHARTHRRLDHS